MESRLFANISGCLLGAIAPFCSCSSIPLFIGFVESGVPLGVTMSFLVASPMITPQGIVAAVGAVWCQGRPALCRVWAGDCHRIVGWIIGRLHLERWVEDYVYQIKMGKAGRLAAR